MAIDRRELLCLTGATAAVAACPQVTQAETYPSRPVRVLVGYAAGGGVDIAARLIGQWLSERFQQQFIVENRTGAATNIATEAVVRSPPDGYTLLLVNAANAINATYYESLTFNFMRDIAPVAGIGRFPYFMAVNPAFPASKRIYRLREGQSAQGQHGDRRRGRTGPRLRRAAPADDWHPNDSRAIPRHDPGAHGSA
jgi:tripartite-type tricarboxylate transporter receptor subunit TctC